jgi:hypothetical protein
MQLDRIDRLGKRSSRRRAVCHQIKLALSFGNPDAGLLALAAAEASQGDLLVTEITPDPIMRIAMGFMASKHLFVASAIGLF